MRPVVLYDGGCPMCSREIAHYRRRPSADDIDWIDITATDDLEARFGVSRDQAMASFHVRDSNGAWNEGAAGFVALWLMLPGYRPLGKAISATGLIRLLDPAYRTFARWRQRRRCADGACETPGRSDPDRPTSSQPTASEKSLKQR